LRTSPLEPRSRASGRHPITTPNNDLHHKNPTVNYGLYFRFWDKLMGTDVMETEYDYLRRGPAAVTGRAGA
jgi:sterol desaturase/sphingolipid hydroxylase (fatty acid hydroxylase superfamily)